MVHQHSRDSSDNIVMIVVFIAAEIDVIMEIGRTAAKV